eukprot:TRINITY_DN12744_c0_g2_i2.p1 TRINITY_DN12744_c0_g2~~TRINITY_DN12744_c0_g2_i2.p1  ORF type:complete len:331 (+),score=48.93 TRINITY_DN12744_c0_g2_i2:784-1776(+)
MYASKPASKIVAWSALFWCVWVVYNFRSGAKHGIQLLADNTEFVPFKSVPLPKGLEKRLCDAFGDERCSELKEKGMWPPLDADYNMAKPSHLLWNTSGDRVLGYVVPERAKEMGIAHITVSHAPRVEYFPTFFTGEEADRLKALAMPDLRPSGVGAGKSSKPGAKGGRTSEGVRLDRGDTFVREMEKRIARVSNFSGAIAERLYVLRYKEGQYYHQHVDAGDHVPRGATFFAWLEDLPPPATGGWTSWPLANKVTNKKRPKISLECSTGLRARPVKGAAVLFYDMTPDGAIDPHSLHAGCPPVNGVKWAVTKWLQIKPPKKHKHNKSHGT